MLIENTLFGEINKEQLAIDRAKEFANRNAEKENILGFSGGKDSIVLYDILKRSGIKFKAKYSVTGIDHPALIYFMKKKYPEVERVGFDKTEDGRDRTMFYLISEEKLLPPTRRMRYCCSELKERRVGEKGDTVFLGVRAEESSNRRKIGMVTFFQGKNIIRPLFDWSEKDIWEYIHKYNLKVPDLYDKFDRLGCIGCPLSSKSQEKELEMYPKFKKAYIIAFDKMVIKRNQLGRPTKWKNGQEVYDWWIGKIKKEKNYVDGQCSIF